MKEARWWERIDEKRIRCNLCPRHCVIEDGKIGFCGARKNINGKLYAITYGKLSSVGIDPIEKKPFFHFWPNSKALSFGSVGCNLACPWCQNWSISKARLINENTAWVEGYTYEVPSYEPEDLFIDGDYQGVSCTYNEPITFAEFCIDVMKIAKKKGLYTCFVTNGCATPEAWEDIAKYLDAANVDLKIFNEEKYLRYCGVKLSWILDSILLLKEKKVWVEITHLVVTGVNDNEEEFRKLVNWIYENCGPDQVLHITRYYPAYRFANPPTPIETLYKFYKIAKEKLRYVYLGNIGEGEDTYCPGCGKVLIRRRIFGVLEWRLKDSKCPFCGYKIPLIGKYIP